MTSATYSSVFSNLMSSNASFVGDDYGLPIEALCLFLLGLTLAGGADGAALGAIAGCLAPGCEFFLRW